MKEMLLLLVGDPAGLARAEEVAGGTLEAAKISQSLVPSHKLATWILHVVRRGLDGLGLHHDRTMEEILYTLIVLGLAWVLAVVLKNVALLIVRKVVAVRHSPRGKELIAQHTFRRCSHCLPPLLFMAMIPVAFTADHVVLHWIMRIATVYFLITFGIALDAVIKFIWVHYNEYNNQDHHPLQGIRNIAVGLVWVLVFIISVSVLIDRSPMTLLAGLGAFAAALMLIFKDSILGFVAGVQLSQNDMVRVGDWIVVPSTMANGTVIDVTLTVVKVQNWDNTIVTLPPYTLVSTSFQNWRNVYTMGQREVSRNIYFDNNSISVPTGELLADLSGRFPALKTFIAQRQAAEAKGEPNEYLNTGSANGTIDTNLGLYRYYLCSYLLAHPQVIHDNYLLVSLNQSERFGVSLNVFFYTKQTSWVPYEAVLSEIMEHFHTVAPLFGLRIYNLPDANSFTVGTNEVKH